MRAPDRWRAASACSASGDNIELVMPSDVTFAKGSAALDAAPSRRVLDKVAESLNLYPQDDDRHRRSRVDRRRRAGEPRPVATAAPNAVRAYLQGKGVLAARMATGGLGEASRSSFRTTRKPSARRTAACEVDAASRHAVTSAAITELRKGRSQERPFRLSADSPRRSRATCSVSTWSTTGATIEPRQRRAADLVVERDRRRRPPRPSDSVNVSAPDTPIPCNGPSAVFTRSD